LTVSSAHNNEDTTPMTDPVGDLSVALNDWLTQARTSIEWHGLSSERDARPRGLIVPTGVAAS